MNAIRLYLGMIALSVRSQLQYRSSLAFQILGQFIITGIEFGGLYALNARFGAYGGWAIAEMAFLYGLVDMAFALADGLAYGFDFMGSLVKTGDFDRLLVRPVSPILQLMGKELTIRRAGRLLQGMAVFGFGALALARSGIRWYAPLPLLALAGAFMAGTAAFLAVFLVQAAFTFWTVEGLEAMNAFSYGGRQAAAYPLSGYRRWMQALFMGVVPVGAATYLPVCFALGRPAFSAWPVWAGALGPLAIVPFCAAALLLWRAGLRRYRSGGG